MGHPKKLKKKWKRPKKLFDKARIEFELELKKEYGFRRKREIWRLEYDFKNIKRRARKIFAMKDKEAEKILINKLVKFGLITKKSGLEDVLNLKLEDFCSRRLQTIVHKKGLANTIKQARQLIVHKKVLVGERIINQPNYIVPGDEEEKILIREKKKEEKPEQEQKEGEQKDVKEEENKGSKEELKREQKEVPEEKDNTRPLDGALFSRSEKLGTEKEEPKK